MNANSSVLPKDQKEKTNLFIEVAGIEKQLWALNHSKGLLHSDVRDLYRKACSSYEKIVLGDHDQAELQDIEYSLWKFHYRHIDEYRKRIKRNSANSEIITSTGKSSDSHIEGFKSFLLEASEFYQNLIVKVRRFYGLPEEFSSAKMGGISASVEPKKMQKCQFLCHRFLVCLGDLDRYREQYEKMGIQNHNWSVAATRYLEATLIWPDSGNPQNQLAVLATYVGDEFLALYHCIRSLAVKEPFPDAWNNLILLFERNRSCHLHSLFTGAYFNFSKPSERSSFESGQRSSDGLSNSNVLKAGQDCSTQTNLWSLIVRSVSFFFIKNSSLDEFPCAFASTMRELDAVMALDDAKLKAVLEAYQLMDSARTGPFRALQVVSIFIFIFDNLTNVPEMKGSEDKKDMQQLELTQLSLTAAFIFMGRLVDRCLEANPLESCPLLPAVLVSVEWLVTKLDEADTYSGDDKVASAMSYLFRSFVDLLEKLNVKGESLSSERTALWEDYELRGFAPVAVAHASLDFSTHWRHADCFDSGTECRVQRILCAAMKIANRSNGSRNWIICGKSGRRFYTAESNVIPERKEPGKMEHPSSDSNLKVKELVDCNLKAKEWCEKHILCEATSNLSVNGKSVATEEEEVILFKPLTRYNSAPLSISVNSEDPGSSKDDDQTLPSDECLRRATSSLIAQNQVHEDPSGFQFDISNFRFSKPFKHQEPPAKDTLQHLISEGPISAGPPSLNAWVLNRGNSSNDITNGSSDINKHRLSPIQEEASESLSCLSVGESEETAVSSSQASAAIQYSPPPYSVPVPSAPLLPDDAAWYNGVQSTFPNVKSSVGITETGNSYDSSQIGGYPNWAATHGPLDYGAPISAFRDGYPPFSGMTSSEWLRQYRESHNLERTNSPMWLAQYYAPGTPRNFAGHGSLGLGLLDQYGTPNPLIHMESSPLYPGLPPVYGVDECRREKLFPGYQRPSPYGCGAMTDLRFEPQPLLQYLKEKEWLLQRDSALRGPTYMGN